MFPSNPILVLSCFSLKVIPLNIHWPWRIGLHRVCPQAKLNSAGRATLRSWHGQQERFVQEAQGDLGDGSHQMMPNTRRTTEQQSKGTSHVICRIELLSCYLHLGDSYEKYFCKLWFYGGWGIDEIHHWKSPPPHGVRFLLLLERPSWKTCFSGQYTILHQSERRCGIECN